MIILNKKRLKIYSIDNLLIKHTKLYNQDGTINENCNRTIIGKLHYDLKVHNKNENIPIISDILINFIKQLNQEFDYIIPVYSNSNKYIKSVCLNISKKFNKPLLDIILKNDNGFNILNKKLLYNKIVLLIDDTYNTGKTIKSIYTEIKDFTNSVLAITFVRNR